MHHQQFFPVFLSVVVVIRNREADLASTISRLTRILTDLVRDHELIIIDNASEDGSLQILRSLTSEGQEPNLQVYALAKEVDVDTASWVGMENALGDYVAVVNPLLDDVYFLPKMLERAMGGIDAVFATNLIQPRQSLPYKIAFGLFQALYKWCNGIDLAREAPQYRLLRKSVVTFVMRHPQPAVAYRHLPATGGFSRAVLEYTAPLANTTPKRLLDSFDRGMRLLVSTTRTPMRIVTNLSLFGALANVAYSVYVVAVALMKSDVAPGWTSLSLQQSGMFFLLSLVLLVLGEYILQMCSLSNEGPLYNVAQEFTSSRMTRRERLNLEEAMVSQLTPPLPKTQGGVSNR